jgi:hypothetical protein
VCQDGAGGAGPAPSAQLAPHQDQTTEGEESKGAAGVAAPLPTALLADTAPRMSAMSASGAGMLYNLWGSVSDAIYPSLYIHMQCAEIAFRSGALSGALSGAVNGAVGASTSPLTSFCCASFLPCSPVHPSFVLKKMGFFFCFLPPYSLCIQNCCCVWPFLSSF